MERGQLVFIMHESLISANERVQQVCHIRAGFTFRVGKGGGFGPILRECVLRRRRLE
jgi:hypothetical protein